MMRTWYAGVFAGGHQGSVADEATGRTVALTYDPADAPLIAEAPAMLEALRKLAAWDQSDDNVQLLSEACSEARSIINDRLEGLK